MTQTFVYSCLMMRDEKSNITKCLSNMSEFVDGYFIEDTGSEDDSIDIARSFIRESGKPGAVTEAMWKNYGWNRTHALKSFYSFLVGEVFKRTGVDVTRPLTPSQIKHLDRFAFYAFVTDLDNTLHYTDPKRKDELVKIDRSQLTHDSYFIESRRGGGVFKTVNLLKIDPLNVDTWAYYRSIHEYVDRCSEYRHRSQSFYRDVFVEYGLSGFRSKDYARCLRDLEYLALDELLYGENDSRTLFYKAQTLKEGGFKDNAFKAYMKRYEMEDSFQDERYVSCLYSTSCIDTSTAEGLKRYLTVLFKGYELNHKRREVPYYLCKYFNDEKLYHMAWNLGKPYVDITPNRDSFLFDESINDFEFIDLMTLASYYSGDRATSLQLMKRLLQLENLPKEMRERVERNVSITEYTIGAPKHIQTVDKTPHLESITRETSTTQQNSEEDACEEDCDESCNCECHHESHPQALEVEKAPVPVSSTVQMQLQKLMLDGKVRVQSS